MDNRKYKINEIPGFKKSIFDSEEGGWRNFSLKGPQALDFKSIDENIKATVWKDSGKTTAETFDIYLTVKDDNKLYYSNDDGNTWDFIFEDHYAKCDWFMNLMERHIDKPVFKGKSIFKYVCNKLYKVPEFGWCSIDHFVKICQGKEPEHVYVSIDELKVVNKDNAYKNLIFDPQERKFIKKDDNKTYLLFEEKYGDYPLDSAKKESGFHFIFDKDFRLNELQGKKGVKV